MLHLILRAVCPEGLELASWIGLGRAAAHRLDSGLGPRPSIALTSRPPSAGVKMKEERTALHCSCSDSVHV